MILDADVVRARERDRRAARGVRATTTPSSPSCSPPCWRSRRRPRPTRARPARTCAALRAKVAAAAAPARAADRLGGHAPVRALGGPARRRRGALPRARLDARLRGAARADLRPARARRPRRRGDGDPRGQRRCASTSRCCSRCRRTRRSGAAQATGLASSRMPIFRGFPRVGIPPAYDGWAGLRAADRADDRGRRDRGLHLDVVRRPPAPEPRHRRGPGDGRADARGAHARPRGADPGARARAGRGLTRRASGSRRRRDELLDANRWLAARNGLDGELVDLPDTRRVRHARARAGGSLERLEPHAQDLGSADELDGRPGPDRARQRSPSAAGRLRGERRFHRGGQRGRQSDHCATRRIVCPWQAGPICSSSARAAAPRCPRTSRSARTAGRGCASARPSSSAAASPKPPRRARPRLAPLRRGEIPGIRPGPAPVRDDRAGRRLGRDLAARCAAGWDRGRRLDADPRARRSTASGGGW